MQILYAAPFIVLSILSFFICLGVPRLRRFALPALIAPVAFGVFSLVGFVLLLLAASHFFHWNTATTVMRVVELFFYLIPGVAGAWFSIKLVRIVEKHFLKTQAARDIVIRLVVAAILTPIGGFAGLTIAVHNLNTESTVALLWIGLTMALLSAMVGFIGTMIIQKRTMPISNEQTS